MGCAVCLWLLQRNAHLYAAWLSGNGAVQAENLVYLLPDGDYDADDLQNEKIAYEKLQAYEKRPPVIQMKNLLAGGFLCAK